MNNLPPPPAAAAAPPQPQVPLPELILSLEQATLMAKQLPATTDPTHLLQIYSSLHQAHQNLSFFVSQVQFHAPEQDGDEPMDVGEDDNEAGGAEGSSNSKATVDKVEEKLRGCFIRNKRAKRSLSPSLMAEEERRLIEDGYDTGIKDYDPYEARIRALDLIYQFHA